MKKLILALALCAFTFASCGDDDENENGEKGTTSSFDGTITGTLKLVVGGYVDGNWAYSMQGDVTTEADEIHAIMYNNETGHPESLSKAAITNGQFTLKLSTPGDKYLESIMEDINDIETVTVSDKSAKVFFPEICAYKDGERVGYISMFPANLTSDTGISFMYANRDVTVKGTETFDSDGPINTYEYDMNLKKGWNVIVRREQGNKYIRTTESIPASMFWGMRT